MTSSNLGAWGAVFLGLIAASACGQTSSPGSGETHFLIRCEDGGCSGGLECLCGVCSKPCTNDRACSSLGESATCVEHDQTSCTTVTKSCDVTCATDPDCRGVSISHVCVDGLCRVLPPPLGSVDDGGAGGAGGAGGVDGAGSSDRAGASGTAMMSGGTAGTGADPGTRVCDQCGDRDCLLWGACSKEDACKARGCGGPTVDDNGCQRPACTQDSDCAGDSRCVNDYFPVVDQVNNGMSACRPSEGVCGCGAYAVLNIVTVCSPIALSGQRGKWTTLRVREFND